MRCSHCQRDSPSGARFCMHCAAPLAARCAGCQTELPAGARFCPQCARPAESPAGPTAAESGDDAGPHPADSSRVATTVSGERRQVTVLFADVKGSMDLAEQLDAEEWSRIMQRFFRILSDGVERDGFGDKFTRMGATGRARATAAALAACRRTGIDP